MFNGLVNMACINSPFSPATMPRMKRMDERMARLYEAARASGKLVGEPEQANLARLLNISQQRLNNWEARGPSKEGVLAAQNLLGVNASWVQSGEGSMFLAGESHRSGMGGRGGELKGGDVFAWDKPEDLPHDPNRVWIDRWDYTCSAGDGGVQWEIRQKDALPFTQDFFKAIGSKPANCKLLMVRGDSMEPLLFNKDMMMVDSSKTAIKDGGVYAVCFEDEPLVKQLFRQAGGALTLHSYNPKYPDRVIPAADMASLVIIGALVYRSGSGFAGG